MTNARHERTAHCADVIENRHRRTVVESSYHKATRREDEFFVFDGRMDR